MPNCGVQCKSKGVQIFSTNKSALQKGFCVVTSPVWMCSLFLWSNTKIFDCWHLVFIWRRYSNLQTCWNVWHCLKQRKCLVHTCHLFGNIIHVWIICIVLMIFDLDLASIGVGQSTSVCWIEIVRQEFVGAHLRSLPGADSFFLRPISLV